jgi:hypothetical protein
MQSSRIQGRLALLGRPNGREVAEISQLGPAGCESNPQPVGSPRVKTSAMNSRPLWVVPLMCGALLAACGGGASTSPSGVIAGVAQPCVGDDMTKAQFASLTVHVTVTQGSQTIATQAVRGSHVYVFTLPPGRYVVSSDALGGAPTAHVNLRAGEVLRTNLGSMCM